MAAAWPEHKQFCQSFKKFKKRGGQKKRSYRQIEDAQEEEEEEEEEEVRRRSTHMTYECMYMYLVKGSNSRVVNGSTFEGTKNQENVLRLMLHYTVFKFIFKKKMCFKFYKNKIKKFFIFFLHVKSCHV